MKFDWLSLLIPSTQFQRKHKPLNSEHIISGTTKIMAVISLFIRKEEICLQLETSFFAIFIVFSGFWHFISEFPWSWNLYQSKNNMSKLFKKMSGVLYCTMYMSLSGCCTCLQKAIFYKLNAFSESTIRLESFIDVRISPKCSATLVYRKNVRNQWSEMSTFKSWMAAE